MKLHYSIEGNVVKVEVFDGEKYSDEGKTVVSEVEFDLAECPAELKDGSRVKTFAAYGLLKWLQDRTSQVKGASAKAEAMVEEFNSKAKEGLWKAPAAERTSAPRGSRRKITATLAQAVSDLLGCTVLEAEANLKALDAEKFASLTGNAKVIARVKEIEAETEVNEDMLADLT